MAVGDLKRGRDDGRIQFIFFHLILMNLNISGNGHMWPWAAVLEGIALMSGGWPAFSSVGHPLLCLGETLNLQQGPVYVPPRKTAGLKQELRAAVYSQVSVAVDCLGRCLETVASPA